MSEWSSVGCCTLIAHTLQRKCVYMISSTARILRQEGHGVHVYEIRQKSQKALHKYNKLTLANLSDCEFVAGTGKCVVFTSSLPLATGVILREIAKLVYMHKLQGEGARAPVPHSWQCQCTCVSSYALVRNNHSRHCPSVHLRSIRPSHFDVC